MNQPPDDRAPLARAYSRATRGITLALGMVLPGLLGHYLDNRFGTKATLTIVGFALGMAYGLWEMLRMARPQQDQREDDGRPH